MLIGGIKSAMLDTIIVSGRLTVRKRSLFLLLIISILLILSVSPVFSAEVGEDAPAFVLTDIERNYVFSKKTYGSGWLLIDFYATWCENCNKELPHVEELYAEFKDQDFNVYLMATDAEGLDVVVPFFAQSPTSLTVLIDKYQKASEAFGVEALPTMFLINPEGKIEYKTIGYHEEDLEELRAILAENLNE